VKGMEVRGKTQELPIEFYHGPKWKKLRPNMREFCDGAKKKVVAGERAAQRVLLVRNKLTQRLKHG